MNAESVVGDQPVRPRSRWLDFAIPCAFALNTLFPVGNLDIWFHLKTGQLIYQTGKIPITDPFSYTAFGNPWINHEWLFGLGAYLLYAASGLPGLIIAKAAVAGALLWLILRTIRRYRVSALMEVEVLLLAAIAIYPRVYVRPHVLTFLFMAYLVWRLDGYRQGAGRELWDLPPLFALWSNIHGGVVFGLGVLGLTVAGDLIDLVSGSINGEPAASGATKKRFGRFVLVACLSGLATLLNPFTYHLHVFITEHLFIGEVVKIAEHVSVFGLGFTFYWVLAGVSVFALIRLWPRARWADVLVVLAFGLFSIKSHRTTPVFAIVAAPVIVKGLGVPTLDVSKASKGILATLAATAVLVAVAAGGQIFPGYYARAGVPPVGFGLYEPRYPIGAAAFVEEHKLPDPLYNEYDFGGYLIWSWYPERKVFQDGRTLVYDREFFRSLYGETTPEDWERVMESYGVRTALVSSRLEENFTEKFTDERWALLYWDEVAAVLLRRIPAHDKWIEPLGYRLLRPSLAGPEIVEMVRQGRSDELERELGRHMALHARSPKAKAFLGWKLLADDKPKEALGAFEEALLENPFLFQANWGAARSLTALGRAEEAKRYWKKLLRLGAEGSVAKEARLGVGQ